MKRQLILVISLACGLLAAVLTRLYISAKEADIDRERQRLVDRYGTIKVLAFKKSTPAGVELSESEIGTKVVPRMGLGGQAVESSDYRQVLGRKLLMSRQQGEVLFWSDVEGGNLAAKGLSDSIKRQMRAMSINVNTASSVSGLVKPNDHVDVIGTFSFPDSSGNVRKGDLVTSTILQNVLVLATGRETANAPDRALGVAAGYSTVTLAVTPREAEMLAFAEQMKGRLTLTLRNRSDTSYERELPQVDYEKIRQEIEELNTKRQMEKLGAGGR